MKFFWTDNILTVRFCRLRLGPLKLAARVVGTALYLTWERRVTLPLTSLWGSEWTGITNATNLRPPS